ncbi:uncharacterized protein FIESC28_08238 [Fusarium coffeatum]|uniref:Uncharacterized protein n=1 Tax=Fusarium coffeatum TaxID=231269 RepID=A0A366R8S9_9HYPO|nr:uncharacterized protein FIESC28_08238 [Fusarium coffeatum]RBR13272.1 hypothetical protein FIESC28_08238 [Fusarium coffeatum]
MHYLSLLLPLGLAVLPQEAHAQQPVCPLLGPIFPPVPHPAKSNAISNAIIDLDKTFKELDRNGTFHELNTTLYVQAFSAADTLFQHGYVPQGMKGFLTSGTLNEDTVFRVGSVSKLLIVYTLLAEVGMDHMSDPVTRWVPELAHAAKKGKGDPTRRVQWNEVTIGQLCGHMSGVSRNFGFFDLDSLIGYPKANPEMYGFPILEKIERRKCDISDPALGPCSRKEFFNGITSKNHFPITSTANTPIYSNLAYQILAYALEGMTGKPFEKSLQSSLLKPLSMKDTTLEAPKGKINAVIPENELLSWWNITTGDGSPYGGMFSTSADLTRLGQSILKSSILDPPTTRAWMKPIAHTADLHMSVGMPWEIRRTLLPLGPNGIRVVDLYTKNGAIGLYTAIVVLSPDHGIGFVALFAGPSRDVVLSYVPDLLANTLLPAAEEAAREAATARFTGTFQGRETEVTLEMEDTLVVKNWARGGVDVLATMAAVWWPGLEVTPILRLYPMVEGDKKMSFRGTFDAKAINGSEPNAEVNAAYTTAGPFSGGCLSWGVMDTLTYGDAGVDDFEFVLDHTDKATELGVRVARETLRKIN